MKFIPQFSNRLPSVVTIKIMKIKFTRQTS
jgi:hypothetical protein